WIKRVETWMLHSEIPIGNVAGAVGDDSTADVVANQKSFHQELISRAMNSIAEFVFAIQYRALAVYLDADQADAGFINHYGLLINARQNLNPAAAGRVIDRCLNGLTRPDGVAVDVRRRTCRQFRGPPPHVGGYTHRRGHRLRLP